MKKYICVWFAFFCQLLYQAQAENFKSDFDLNSLDKMVQEDIIKARNESLDKESIDGAWMVRLFINYQKGVKVTEEDLNRIWQIYEITPNPRSDDKLYAFSLICELEDISKWEKEFDSLALSEDPKFVKTAIETMIWKMDRGNQREKIVLSSKTSILNRLVDFAKSNQAEMPIYREIVRISELAKKYAKGDFSRELQRSDESISNTTSSDNGIPEKIALDSLSDESLQQNFSRNKGLAAFGIIGVFIIMLLILRANSK